MLIFAIAAMGVGFLGGYGGMVSLGQASFLGLGAYGVAVPMSDGAGPWTAIAISLVVTLRGGAAHRSAGGPGAEASASSS